jgi:hypothetical protein
LALQVRAVPHIPRPAWAPVSAYRDRGAIFDTRHEESLMFVLALVGSLAAAVGYIMLAKFILARHRKDD